MVVFRAPQDTERAYRVTPQEVRNLAAYMVRVLGLKVALVARTCRVADSTLRKQLSAPRPLDEIRADAKELLVQPLWAARLANINPRLPQVSVHWFDPECSARSGVDLRQTLMRTSRTLEIVMYLWTDKTVADIVIDLHRRVKVCVVTDLREARKPESQIRRLVDAGIPVVAYKPPQGCMHIKFWLSDSVTLVTGSYNFTPSAAAKNWEVTITLADLATAGEFGRKFKAMWKQLKKYKLRCGYPF